MNRPLLLGHRGARARKSIPENTLASFDHALADGCDGFEFDLRQAADDTAVVGHDPHAAGLEIAATASHLLPHLPKLRDVLSRYQNSAFLDIELKVSGIEDATLALLRELPPRQGFVISSFLPSVMRETRARNSAVSLGLICETPAQLSRWSELPEDSLIVHRKLLTSDLISELKSAAKRVFVWTVNDATEMKRFAGLGVDGIISDDTDLLCKTLTDRG